MDNKKIGKLISSLRRQQGLTQQDLGDKVGVGFRAVSKWERGITLPDISIINELSKILGISSDELLEGELKKSTKKKDNKKIPTSIKVTISIITSIIIIISSILILNSNKTYVYDIKKIDGADYYIEGQVTYKKGEISIIVNKLYFTDDKLNSTIIKNYEYDIFSNNKHLFGYSLGSEGRIIEENSTIENVANNFQINYAGKTDIKMQEMVKNNITIILKFINEKNEQIIKKVEFTLISQKEN